MRVLRYVGGSERGVGTPRNLVLASYLRVATRLLILISSPDVGSAERPAGKGKAGRGEAHGDAADVMGRPAEAGSLPEAF